MLELLGPESRVVAMDRDPQAVRAGEALAAADERLRVRHGKFSELGRVLASLEIKQVQGVMMDLGVSSPQLDDPQRGFSFRFDEKITFSSTAMTLVPISFAVLHDAGF